MSSATFVPRPAGEVLEIRERAGGLQHVVDDRSAGRRGRHLIEHRLERVVLDDDQVGRFLGDVRVGGKHDGDRLADVADLLERQNRLIVKGGPVVRIRDQLSGRLRR